MKFYKTLRTKHKTKNRIITPKPIYVKVTFVMSVRPSDATLVSPYDLTKDRVPSTIHVPYCVSNELTL